jgi:hypothetical protein
MEDKETVIEWIIRGKDDIGVLLAAESEDAFLDGINILKQTILAGFNPLVVFQLI